VDEDSKRWHEITPSSFDHERAALRYVRDLLPDRVPYEAWSNFTFVSDQGHIREVDLLVVAPTGLFLIEIKNFRGRLSNQGFTWTLAGKSRRSFDNPLPLADQKSKELRTLLKRAAAKERGVNVPFLRGCVFLAEPQMQCELEEGQRSHLYVPDGARSAGTLLQIGADLLLGRVTHAPPQRDFLQALPRLLQRVGVHRTRKSVTVGPWQIEPRPYDTGPTWQDHHAGREDLPGEYRRIRIYLYERQSDAEARESVRHAAQREYLAAQGIEHPGLLVPRDLLDHEMGPALVIDQHRDAVRLDHYMAGDGRSLDLPVRLGLVRQLAEAVGYAHDRRLVHRALSPRAVIVEPGRDGTPRLRVGEWQAAARGMSAAKTAHQVAPTTHAARHVEAAAAAYLAPEFTQDVDGTTPIDIFGLGATAYLILTGQAPAAGRSELAERLAREGGLSPSAIDESIPPDVDALMPWRRRRESRSGSRTSTSSSPRSTTQSARLRPILPRRIPGMPRRGPSCRTATPCAASWAPAPQHAPTSWSATGWSPCSRSAAARTPRTGSATRPPLWRACVTTTSSCCGAGSSRLGRHATRSRSTTRASRR
jgi:hypothetical protein